MKRYLALPIIFLLAAAPACAFAETASPFTPTPLQLLTRAAALEAQLSSVQSGQTLACAMLSSAATTTVGRDVILAWGSAGAIEQHQDTRNTRPLAGAVTLNFSAPGAWTYAFTFYDSAGRSATCTQKIVVAS